MELIISVLAGLSMFLFVLGIRFYRTRPASQVVLEQQFEASHPVVREKPSYFERRLRPFAQTLAKRFPNWRKTILPQSVEQKIVYAGYPMALDGDQLYGLQLLAAVACALIGFVAGLAFGELPGGLIGLAVGMGGGLAAPPLWIDGEANKRQREISASVPDSLELLVTCVEASIGFDSALQHIQANMKGPLAQEYGTFLRELHMGVPRREAFHRLLGRNSSQELHIVIGALMQGQELGVPVAKTLQEQAEEMRVRRLQRAKEIGAQASPKIALITTMIVAPAVMCLFLSVVVFGTGKDIFPMLKEFMGR